MSDMRGVVAAAACLVLVACPTQRSVPGEAERTAVAGYESAIHRDSLSGWFHVIWGNGKHYLLVTASGESFQLLLEPVVLDSIGDPLLLDRRHVTVVGKELSPKRSVIRVFGIHPSPPH